MFKILSRNINTVSYFIRTPGRIRFRNKDKALLSKYLNQMLLVNIDSEYVARLTCPYRYILCKIAVMDEKIVKKIVAVGDGGCGKTCLLTVFATNEFPEDHIPTIFDTYIKDLFVDEKHFSLVLSDTAGEEDYDRLRPLSYSRTDLVLICFSIDNRVSLDNVKLKWYPEIKHFLPYVHYFLIGTKLDQRGEGTVTYEEGLKMSKRIRADGYIECSAKYSLGVRRIFEEGARMSLTPKKRSYLKVCYIL